MKTTTRHAALRALRLAATDRPRRIATWVGSPSRRATGIILGMLAVLSGCGGGDGGNAGESAPGDGPNAILYYPDRLAETAPETFRVRFETTAGVFLVDVTRTWAPNGADRFYNLVKNGYYDGVYFHRVMAGFMAQFGMHGEPQVQVRWKKATIDDDPVMLSNTRGTVSYAKTNRPNSRATQLFINFGDNAGLDAQGFAPFGRVIEGMEVVDQLHAGYGNIADLGGNGPDTRYIEFEGNNYLEENFPELDHIISATLVEPAGG